MFKSITSMNVNLSDVQLLHTAGPDEPPTIPCVDCGLITGNFCDGAPASVGLDQCYATKRVPNDYPREVFGLRRTPLCTFCESRFLYCRFCRGVTSCTPPSRHEHWSGFPSSRSRQFTEEIAQLCIRKEHHLREQIRREAFIDPAHPADPAEVARARAAAADCTKLQ